MSDQTIHNVTSLDWVVIDWIGENRTVSASAMTWLEWHEELLELRAERDALAAEISRLRTLEAAAIEWANAEYSKNCTVGRKNPAVDTRAAALAYRLYKLVTKATS